MENTSPFKEFIYNIIGIANTKEKERSDVDILAFKLKRHREKKAIVFECVRCQALFKFKKELNQHKICKNCIFNNKANQDIYVQLDHDYCHPYGPGHLKVNKQK